MKAFCHIPPDSPLTPDVSEMSARIGYIPLMRHTALPLLLALFLHPLPAGGKDGGNAARAAVERGEILPLARILAEVHRVHPGQLVETELEIEDGAHIYEIEILTPEGRLIEIEVDAATGAILAVDDEEG